jgi:hypothetical protein
MYPPILQDASGFPKPARKPQGPDLSSFEPVSPEPDMSSFEPVQEPTATPPVQAQTPYTGNPDRLPAEAPPDTPPGKAIWDELNRPHINFGDYTKPAEEALTDPNAASRSIPDFVKKNFPNLADKAQQAIAMEQGALSGGLKGLADTASGYTSDLGLLTAAPTGGDIPLLSSAIRTLSRLGGAAFAVHGAGTELDPNKSWQEKLQAIPEIAGGVAGAFHSPHAPIKEMPPAPPEVMHGPTPADALTHQFNQPIDLTKETRPTPAGEPVTPPAKSPSGKALTTKFNKPLTLQTEGEAPPGMNLLDYNVPQTHQPAFGDPAPFTRPTQLDFGDLPQEPTKFTSGAQQQGLDMGGNTFMPNEFLPDGAHLPEARPPFFGTPPDLEKGTKFNSSFTNKQGWEEFGPKPGEIPSNKQVADAMAKRKETSPEPPRETPAPEEDIVEKAKEDPQVAEELANHPEVDPELLDRFRQSLEKDRLARESDSEMRNLFPQEMRAKNKPENVAMGGADPRVLSIIGTTLYKSDRPLIAAKELIQNAADEHRISGTKEPIRTLTNEYDIDPVTNKRANSLTVKDKGRGLTKDQIYTVLTDLGKSGKMDEKDASGGFGFAKAAPMLGGTYSKYESIVKEGGKILKHTFEGTPEQLKNQDEGVPITTTEMPPGTPTGFQAKVYYPETNDFYYASRQIKNMGENSLNNDSPIIAGRNIMHTDSEQNKFLKGEPGTELESKYSDTYVPKSKPKLQDTIHIPGADINIHYDEPTDADVHQNFGLDVQNNGLHQFNEGGRYSEYGPLRSVPGKVTADVRANVVEGEEGYPFNSSRENMSQAAHEAVNKWINDNLISGALEKQKDRLRAMYKDMTPIQTDTPTKRPVVLYDPGDILTQGEHAAIKSSPFINAFSTLMDSVIDTAVKAAGQKGWGAGLEKIGISMDPDHHGIHIPNPDKSGKSTILINPFISMGSMTPEAAADFNIATALHEVGHIGDIRDQAKWDNVDMSHPDIGPYMKNYVSEVSHSHTVRDAGHGLNWLNSLSHIYDNFGPDKFEEASGALKDVIDYNQSGGANDATIPDLLRIYSEREGRVSTPENLLNRTGIKSDASRGRGKSVQGDATANGGGTASTATTPEEQLFGKRHPLEQSTTESVKQVQQNVPQHEIPQRIANIGQHGVEALKTAKPKEKAGIIRQMVNFQRTMLTAYDLSAPGKQGLGLIMRPEWWKSWKPMMEAMGSEGAYNNIMQSIKDDPSGFFQDAKGGSFARKAGLELTDAANHREEYFQSHLAEKMLGARPSIRAYTAYINKLRADTFKSMVKQAGAENNLVDAGKIADYINVTTGRGSLGAKFDAAAPMLADMFFAPRFQASRLQMWGRAFNPRYYMNVPPVVRTNMLKSVIGLAGTGLLMGQLAKQIGATVNNDPYNTDFGKIRFGSTRVDPFDGYQQYLVAASRIAMGQSTSSITGKTSDLTHPKFGGQTRKDVAERFVANKLAPVPSFVWSWMAGKDFDGTPFDAKVAMAKRITPIVAQDLYDIWKDDPSIAPNIPKIVQEYMGKPNHTGAPSAFQGALASGASIAGLGTQTYGR